MQLIGLAARRVDPDQPVKIVLHNLTLGARADNPNLQRDALCTKQTVVAHAFARPATKISGDDARFAIEPARERVLIWKWSGRLGVFGQRSDRASSSYGKSIGGELRAAARAALDHGPAPA